MYGRRDRHARPIRVIKLKEPGLPIPFCLVVLLCFFLAYFSAIRANMVRTDNGPTPHGCYNLVLAIRSTQPSPQCPPQDPDSGLCHVHRGI